MLRDVDVDDDDFVAVATPGNGGDDNGDVVNADVVVVVVAVTASAATTVDAKNFILLLFQFFCVSLVNGLVFVLIGIDGVQERLFWNV